MEQLVFGVSDFVAVFNQTLEMAYPSVVIRGELANLRVSKNRWVYFDLKDEFSSLKFFGTVYNLPGPLEDGMTVEVRGTPRLHPQYGFSITVQNIQLTGEGSILRAQALLLAKLEAEGLFDAARKRPLPYPPAKVGLITSAESAAYVDFIKILKERWGGIAVELADVQVQGEPAPEQITRAIEWFNERPDLPEVLVLIRGGGSTEDLAAFSTEQVTRAVAASRIPTLVAIGHEVDVSPAELAADRRASTPSNAAELLVPSKNEELRRLQGMKEVFDNTLSRHITDSRAKVGHVSDQLHQLLAAVLTNAAYQLRSKGELLAALNPEAILGRGYAMVSKGDKVVKRASELTAGDSVKLRFSDAARQAQIKEG